jgi:tartrate dehydratase beta subunit/fumarate hydratase class I family protein
MTPEEFKKLKVGDKVILTGAGFDGTLNCCKAKGYINGNKYIVTQKDRVHAYIKSEVRGDCMFHYDDLKIPINSFAELLED